MTTHTGFPGTRRRGGHPPAQRQATDMQPRLIPGHAIRHLEEEIIVNNIGPVNETLRTCCNSKDAMQPQSILPEASVPPRCTSCCTTMRETSKVFGPSFSTDSSWDTTGSCAQIPSLDTTARRSHVPVPRHQLLDSDPNSKDNGMDSGSRTQRPCGDTTTGSRRRDAGNKTDSWPAIGWQQTDDPESEVNGTPTAYGTSDNDDDTTNSLI